MTRPLGKSPARVKAKSSPIALNKVSLIDVRAEDDSLLPRKGKISPQGKSTHACPVASPFNLKGVNKTLACIQEDQPECEETQGLNEDEVQDTLAPLATDELAVKKKKKKTGFNLRKSLAWNNAFFTEEGVLDPEELSLVNRTFKKPPAEEPKPSSNRKPALPSKLLNTSAIAKINFSPVRFQKPPVQAESGHRNVALGNHLSRTGNASKRADLHNNGIKGLAGNKHAVGALSTRGQADLIKHDKSMVSIRTEFQGLKPSPLKKLMEENQRTSSGPPLPARGSPKPPLDQSKRTQSISSTLSSASKKMKDRLGMVFTGRNMVNPKGGTKLTAEDDAVVSSSSVPHHSESAKLARCYSHSSYERFGRSTNATSAEPATSTAAVPMSNAAIGSRASSMHGAFVSKGTPLAACNGYSSSLEPRFPFHHVKEQATAAFFSHSQGTAISTRPPQQMALADVKSISKETSGSEVLLSRAKPSGLRMPSPKLGFFDKAKTTNAAHVAVLRERTNGLGYDGITMQSARYTGATQPSTDVGGMSNAGINQSNGSGIISQSFKNTCRQPIVSANVNNYAKQTFALKTLVPSVNSTHLHSEATGRCNGANVIAGIPTAPLLQATDNSSMPVAALSQGSSSMGPCTKVSVPLSILNPLGIPAAPHLQYTDNSSKPVAVLSQGSSSMTSGPCATASVPSSILDPPIMHESFSIPHNSTSMTHGTPSVSSSITGNDISDSCTVLQVKKNVQNVLPAVKKLVTQLSLSPLRIVSGQENLIIEHPQGTGRSQDSPIGREKACSNENISGARATGTQEEWPQVKSGAVQHSPPNKEPPKYGPWSPVRRNAPELGPFDCTKYTNTGVLH